MKPGAIWIPLACYLGVTVVVPLLNGHLGRGASTHLLTVVLTASLLTLLRIAFGRARQRWRR
ncbi:MAG TPA: hypothetical protein VKZ49_01255 [Polyangiaceae bacterium]|nr:hypothetical protein [Polyangiaceae bacterium]